MIIFLLLALGMGTANSQQINVKESRVELVVGMSKSFRLDFVPFNQYEPASPKTVEITMVPAKRELTFNPVRPGTETISFRDARTKEIQIRYVVTVTLTEKSKIIKELQEFLGGVEGIEIGVIGDNVYIRGKLVVPSDIGLIVTVLKQYDKVMNLVELSPQTQLIIAQRMQQDINNEGSLSNVRVRVINGKFVLEGIAGENGKQRAEDIAKLYLPDRIESLARRQDAVARPSKEDILVNFIVENRKKEPGPLPKLIKITAQFVELTKDYNRLFGFKWNPVLSGTGGEIQIGKRTDGSVSSGSQGTLSAVISNLFPKLETAKNAGYARVVQSGIVVTEEGQDANIKRESKKTTSVGSGEFTTPVPVSAGFDLNVRPEIIREEQIKLTTNIAVSSEVGGAASDTETLNNNVKTIIIVKSKESAVVGGVVTSKSTTEFDKATPDQLSDGGSFLFNFIRSKNIVRNKSQFVFFITPEIIENAAAGTEEISRQFRRRGR